MQYGIGLPLGSFLLLYKFRHRLHTDKFRFRLGLLYSGYRHDRWWWENVVAARKVIIICFSCIWFNETIQVHLVLGLMMLLLVAHYSFLPYDTTTKEGRLLHKVERNSLVALLSMLWAGVVFLMDSDQKCNSTLCIYVHNALVLLVILINVLLLSHGSYLFVYFFCKRNHLLEKIDTYQIRNKIASSLHLRLRLPSLSSLSPLSRPSSTSNLSGIEMKELDLSGKTEEVTNPVMNYSTGIADITDEERMAIKKFLEAQRNGAVDAKREVVRKSMPKEGSPHVNPMLLHR